MHPAARVLAPVLLGLGSSILGVAILVAPPHAVVEASPPPDSDIPTVLICRSGGPMRFDFNPQDHYLNYKIHAGTRPKSLRDIKPGHCASGDTDIPLGAATTPSLRIDARVPGMAGNVGFSVSVTSKGAATLRGVAQPRCAAVDDPACAPTDAQRDHANMLDRFAERLQSEGQLFQIPVGRDPERGLGPVADLRMGVISFPKDI